MYEVCCGHRFTHDTLRLTVHAVSVRFFPSFVFPIFCGHSTNTTNEHKRPFTNLYFFFNHFSYFLLFFLCSSIVSYRNDHVILKMRKSSYINYACSCNFFFLNNYPVVYFTFNWTVSVVSKIQIMREIITAKNCVFNSHTMIEQSTG